MATELKDKIAESWAKLPKVLRDAMELAKIAPGRYGGRYVGRVYNRTAKRDEFVICDDDDPEKYHNDSDCDLDILAQATPTKIHPIGGARNYINADGTIEFHEPDGSVERYE